MVLHKFLTFWSAKVIKDVSNIGLSDSSCTKEPARGTSAGRDYYTTWFKLSKHLMINFEFVDTGFTDIFLSDKNLI